MNPRQFLASGVFFVTGSATAAAVTPQTTDAFVYGSTPAGLAAATAKDTSTSVAALDPDPLPGKLGIQVVR